MMAYPAACVDTDVSYAPFHRDGNFVLHPRAPMSWDEFESARRLYGATIDVFALPDEAAVHAKRFGLLLEEVAHDDDAPRGVEPDLPRGFRRIGAASFIATIENRDDYDYDVPLDRFYSDDDDAPRGVEVRITGRTGSGKSALVRQLQELWGDAVVEHRRLDGTELLRVDIQPRLGVIAADGTVPAIHNLGGGIIRAARAGVIA